MPWNASSVMEERRRFVACLPDGRGDDGSVPGIRDIPQDRLHDYDRFGARARSEKHDPMDYISIASTDPLE